MMHISCATVVILILNYRLVAFVYCQACRRIWVGHAPVRLIGRVGRSEVIFERT